MMFWFAPRAARRIAVARKGAVLRIFVVSVFGTLWCLAGGAVALGIWRDVDRRATETRFDIIVADSTTAERAANILADLRRKPGVMAAEYKSSSVVWREFSATLGIADTDLQTIASVPAVIRLQLAPSQANPKALRSLENGIRILYGNAVADIVWSKPYAELLELQRRDVALFSLIAGALSLVLFSVAISYSFRAEIHRATDDLRVGVLLGASWSWTAMPHFMVSATVGAMGVLVATGVLLLARPLVESNYPWVASVSTLELLIAAVGIAVVGKALAWWQSYRAVRSGVKT